MKFEIGSVMLNRYANYTVCVGIKKNEFYWVSYKPTSINMYERTSCTYILTDREGRSLKKDENSDEASNTLEKEGTLIVIFPPTGSETPEFFKFYSWYYGSDFTDKSKLNLDIEWLTTLFQKRESRNTIVTSVPSNIIETIGKEISKVKTDLTRLQGLLNIIETKMKNMDMEKFQSLLNL